MKSARFILGLILLAACGEQQPASDSTAALAVDTLKPVVVDSAAADKVATPAASTNMGAKSATTKTAPRTVTKRDSLSPNIGRDSVIRPKGRMPAIDTPTKKP